MRDWNEVEDWLRARAHGDVVERGAIRPTLVAFAGPAPRLIAGLRAFTDDGAAALDEVLGLAVPLGADRLAVSFGGRTSGPADPGEGPAGFGGGREVLVIAVAERDAGASARCMLTPYAHLGTGVVWGRRLVTTAVNGWPVAALTAAATSAPPAAAATAARARRCLALGHQLAIPTAPEHTEQ